MRDPVEAFIDSERLGTLEQRIPLGGQLTHGAAPLAPNLCRTSRGLFVVGARDASQGMVLDASSQPLRYVSGRFGDALEVAGVRLSVPFGARARVLEAIAVSRLRRSAAHAVSIRYGGSYVQRLPELYAWWLASEIDPAETVLAALTTGDVAQLSSEIVEDARARPVFIMTDRRMLLVALSVAGDVWHVALPREPLGLEGRGGKLEVSAGARRWTAARNTARCFEDLSEAAGLVAPDRILAVARANWRESARDAARVAYVRFLVERAAAAGSALAPFVQFLLAAELGESPAARPDPKQALQGLVQGAAAPGALAEAWTAWGLGGAAGRELVDALGDLGDPWKSELELAACHRSEPASGARLGLLARVSAQRGDQAAWREALLERACLDPLDDTWLQELTAAATGATLERARRVAEVLAPGGLARGRPLPSGEPRALSSEGLEEALVHPSARDENLIGRMQALLAVVPKPDGAALRDYVERVSPERGRAVHGALERASRVLGHGAVEAYVSRGIKSVGVRAYEGEPAQVLIGSRHLEAGDPFAMTEAELAFVLAGEVAHLRLGHARVTSSEVWAGALSRSRQGFDLVLGVLPMIKGWSVATRAQFLMQKLPPDLMRRLLARVGEIAAERKLEEAAKNSQVLSRLNEQLVQAHRVMQLSADRAGILLAGDPGVALRAMLLTRPDYRAWLSRVEQGGLGPELAALGREPAPELQDLTVRVRALLGFYLSRGYERLAHEIWSTS